MFVVCLGLLLLVFTTEPRAQDGGHFIRGLSELLFRYFEGSSASNFAENDELKGAPIPSGADAYIWSNLSADERSFYQRMQVDAYRSGGLRDSKWDLEAVRYLEAYSDYATSTLGAPDFDQLAEHGDAVIELGCKDPLVLYLYATILLQQDRLVEASEILRKASGQLDTYGYSPLLQWASVERFTNVLQLRGLKGRANHAQRRTLDLAVETVAGNSVRAEEQRFLYLFMDDVLGSKSIDWLQSFVDQISAIPEADPWLVNLLAGRLHRKLAWQERGGGYADTVPDEGWRGWKEHLEKARKHFSSAYELNPSFPEPASQMIGVAMGGGGLPGEGPRFWFDRTVAAQFDYLPAYEDLLWALRPRWGGSHLEMLEFATECLDSNRFDTRIPQYMLTTVQSVSDELADDYREVLLIPGVREKLDRMADGYLTQPQSDPDRGWYYTLKAAVAWRCDDFAAARAALDNAGSHFEPIAFLQVGAHSDLATGEIYLRTGADANAYLDALKHYEAENYQEAMPLYRELLATSDDEKPGVRTLLQSAIWNCEKVIGLQGVDWVDLMPGENLLGWEVKRGIQWTWENPDTVKGEAGENGLRMLCRTPFPPRFELTVNMDFVTSNLGKFNGGLVFGYKNPDDWYSFIAYAKPRKAVLGFQYHEVYDDDNKLQGVPAPSRRRETNVLSLKVWDGKAYAFVNGECVYAGHRLADAADFENTRIGLGGYFWYESPVLRFSGVKARRLTEPPEDSIPGETGDS
jgi:hypothetical protein